MFGNKPFTDTTHIDHGLLPAQEPHTSDSFEAVVFRLYGGIHHTFDNDDGQASGHRIGQAITDRVHFKTNKNKDIK
jgi:hypothetical protein